MPGDGVGGGRGQERVGDRSSDQAPDAGVEKSERKGEQQLGAEQRQELNDLQAAEINRAAQQIDRGLAGGPEHDHAREDDEGAGQLGRIEELRDQRSERA